MLDQTGVENPDKAVRSAGFPYNIADHHSKLRKMLHFSINDYNKLSVLTRIFCHIYL